MTKTYVINRTVIFNTEKHYLRRVSLKAQSDCIQLNTPASKCFQVLLAHRPSIVTQKDLLEAVWGAQGAFVSPNTLYQNISLLRKALKTLDLEDVVRTVSKKGLVVDEFLFVEELDEEDICPQTIDTNTVIQNCDSAIMSENPRNYTHWGVAVSLVAAMIMTGILLCHFSLRNHNDFFENYTLLVRVNDCDVFRPESDRVEERYIDFIKSIQFKCPQNGVIYLTMPKGRMQVSMVVCNNAINSIRVRCSSLNLWKVQGHE